MSAKAIFLSGFVFLLGFASMETSALAARRDCIKKHYYALKKIDPKAGYGILITTARHLCD